MERTDTERKASRLQERDRAAESDKRHKELMHSLQEELAIEPATDISMRQAMSAIVTKQAIHHGALRDPSKRRILETVSSAQLERGMSLEDLPKAPKKWKERFGNTDPRAGGWPTYKQILLSGSIEPTHLKKKGMSKEEYEKLRDEHKRKTRFSHLIPLRDQSALEGLSSEELGDVVFEVFKSPEDPNEENRSGIPWMDDNGQRVVSRDFGIEITNRNSGIASVEINESELQDGYSEEDIRNFSEDKVVVVKKGSFESTQAELDLIGKILDNNKIVVLFVPKGRGSTQGSHIQIIANHEYTNGKEMQVAATAIADKLGGAENMFLDQQKKKELEEAGVYEFENQNSRSPTDEERVKIRAQKIQQFKDRRATMINVSNNRLNLGSKDNGACALRQPSEETIQKMNVEFQELNREIRSLLGGEAYMTMATFIQLTLNEAQTEVPNGKTIETKESVGSVLKFDQRRRFQLDHCTAWGINKLRRAVRHGQRQEVEQLLSIYREDQSTMQVIRKASIDLEHTTPDEKYRMAMLTFYTGATAGSSFKSMTSVFKHGEQMAYDPTLPKSKSNLHPIKAEGVGTPALPTFMENASTSNIEVGKANIEGLGTVELLEDWIINVKSEWEGKKVNSTPRY